MVVVLNNSFESILHDVKIFERGGQTLSTQTLRERNKIRNGEKRYNKNKMENKSYYWAENQQNWMAT